MSASTSTGIITINESVQGIIFRTLAAFQGRYVYLPFPGLLSTASNDTYTNAMIANSLNAAPHFPNITILDSISNYILYQTFISDSFFHVYNLMTQKHFSIPFPYPLPFINAALTLDQKIHFKVIAVCIGKHFSNPLEVTSKKLVFFVFSSETNSWSSVENPDVVLYSNDLLANIRKPAHAGEEIVYIDLTNHFLIRFTTLDDMHVIECVRKLRLSWEDPMDQTMRHAGSRGWLHCVKFNPHKVRIEVYRWEISEWKIQVIGLENCVRGRVIGLYPFDPSLVFLRSEHYDGISLVDIKTNKEWDIVEKKGEKCGEVCFLRGFSEMLEAACRGGGKLMPSNCEIAHPHEHVDGHQGEIFIIPAFNEND